VWNLASCASPTKAEGRKSTKPHFLLLHSYFLLLASVTVTNHAGRVVTGEFGGVTNGTFVVAGKAYPLSILPKGEQKRMKALAGLDVRTAREKRLDHARDMQLERIRLREQEGEIGHETADMLRAEACGRLPPKSRQR